MPTQFTLDRTGVVGPAMGKRDLERVNGVIHSRTRILALTFDSENLYGKMHWKLQLLQSYSGCGNYTPEVKTF